MKKILIIYENFKELRELYEIATKISNDITIISPSKLYKDIPSIEFLKKLQKQQNVSIKYLRYKDINFAKIPKIKKLLITLYLKKELKKMRFDSFDLTLSGIQTIFSRIIYNLSRKNNNLFFVYHRHLIFSSPFNSKRKLIGNKLFKRFVAMFDIEEFFIDIPNIGYADKYFVVGEVNKNYLINNKVNEKNIFVTGSLEYDFLVDKINSINSSYKMNNKFSVVFITSAFEWVKEYKKDQEQNERIIQMINFVKNKSDLILTIRVHPRENYDKYKLLQRKFPFIKIEFPSANSIIEDLYKYDLIVGWLSTAMFEISLLDKKVLFYLSENDLKDYKEILKYIPSNAIITKISENLQSMGKNIDVSKIIFFNKSEKAIDRITNIIKKELNVK